MDGLGGGGDPSKGFARRAPINWIAKILRAKSVKAHRVPWHCNYFLRRPKHRDASRLWIHMARHLQNAERSCNCFVAAENSLQRRWEEWRMRTNEMTREQLIAYLAGKVGIDKDR